MVQRPIQQFFTKPGKRKGVVTNWSRKYIKRQGSSRWNRAQGTNSGTSYRKNGQDCMTECGRQEREKIKTRLLA